VSEARERALTMVPSDDASSASSGGGGGGGGAEGENAGPPQPEPQPLARMGKLCYSLAQLIPADDDAMQADRVQLMRRAAELSCPASDPLTHARAHEQVRTSLMRHAPCSIMHRIIPHAPCASCSIMHRIIPHASCASCSIMHRIIPHASCASCSIMHRIIPHAPCASCSIMHRIIPHASCTEQVADMLVRGAPALPVDAAAAGAARTEQVRGDSASAHTTRSLFTQPLHMGLWRTLLVCLT
jgi:hypothetical protein